VLELLGVLGIFALAVYALTRRGEDRGHPGYEAWCAKHHGTVARIDGVPVTVVRPISFVIARAEYVLGQGPGFAMNPTLTRRAEIFESATAQLEAIDRRYRQHGEATVARPTVGAAILAHVRGPQRALWIDASDTQVEVSMVGDGADVEAIDRIAAIAAAIARHDAVVLERLAPSMDAVIERSGDGRLALRAGGRVAVRVRLVRTGPERRPAIELVARPAGVAGSELALDTPAVVDVLRRLRALPGVTVHAAPALVAATFDGIPAPERLREAITLLEDVVEPQVRTPFR
jgi:hypothetical protein